jgi:hypothetical protein
MTQEGLFVDSRQEFYIFLLQQLLRVIADAQKMGIEIE